MMNRREFIAASARLGLLAGATCDPSRLFAAESRRTVRGHVTGGGKPLGRVLVSDGRRVTRTDSDGRFEIAVGPQSGPFLFVTTPAGYWAEIALESR